MADCFTFTYLAQIGKNNYCAIAAWSCKYIRRDTVTCQSNMMGIIWRLTSQNIWWV